MFSKIQLKKITAAILLFTSSSFIIDHQHVYAATKYSGIVNATILNVRSGPGTNYKIIGKLKKNTKVVIDAQKGNWSQIEFNHKTSYVSSRYLSKVKKMEATNKTAVANSNQSSNQFLVIAHRGASLKEPEETVNAFNEAIKEKADFIEFDLHMTKDHQLVAIHDDTVNRTTNGKGNVNTFTLEKLKKLDAGYHFFHKNTSIKIPALDEIFKQYGNKTKYYIETKNAAKVSVGQEKLILQLMRKYHIDEKNVIIESFHLDSLQVMHQLNSKIKLVQLFYIHNAKELSNMQLDAISKIGYGIGINDQFISSSFIKQVNKKGLKINVYTIDDKTKMKRLIDMGVNGIFTNNPELLKQVAANKVSK
ncbi:glycerophosphodiester phosphodiesterase family protein [Heyndrickxia ginsengihumi]|uniref:glycerophosphodiester phosphodiesterase family protein n=1 Tax=Heyndrickxia ginsengihumi TaxID=363870 RepID=UPI003D1AD130